MKEEIMKELEKGLEKMEPMMERLKKQHEEMLKKDIMVMTKEQLQELENFKPKENFNAIVIVPMEENHDSDFSCMKFILLKGYEIVGVVSGWSDVININGIGGYGEHLDLNKSRKGYSWNIDCLPISKCVRLFINDKKELYTDSFIGSNFIFYVKED